MSANKSVSIRKQFAARAELISDETAYEVAETFTLDDEHIAA